MSRPITPAGVRFWRNVSATGSACECWLWTASLNAGGYGKFRYDGSRNIVAHRFSYSQTIGAIPHGLQLDHLCRVRTCVNPWHLEPVTGIENVRRGESGSKNRNKTTCVNGHELSGDNVIREVNAHGPRRACKRCVRDSQRKYEARKREERRKRGAK